MTQKFSAGKTAGRPFTKGADPRRGVGKPGRSGRPKDVVRAACRVAFDQRIPVLTQIADGQIADVSPGDRIRALDVLAKYGGLNFTEQEARSEVTVDVGGREQADRAWLLNAMRQMHERVTAARSAELPSADPDPEPVPASPSPPNGDPGSRRQFLTLSSERAP